MWGLPFFLPERKFRLPIELKGLAGLMPFALMADGNMLFGIPLVAGTDNVRVCVVYFFRL
jgi:hypothetical protein